MIVRSYLVPTLLTMAYVNLSLLPTSRYSTTWSNPLLSNEEPSRTLSDTGYSYTPSFDHVGGHHSIIMYLYSSMHSSCIMWHPVKDMKESVTFRSRINWSCAMASHPTVLACSTSYEVKWQTCEYCIRSHNVRFSFTSEWKLVSFSIGVPRDWVLLAVTLSRQDVFDRLQLMFALSILLLRIVFLWRWI